MEIGRKIYFDKLGGSVLVDTGERSGYVHETTQDDDFAAYTALAERVPETVGMIQLEYGQYSQDFSECDGFRVNPSTYELEFSYPDPNGEELEEPLYQLPLSEQVKSLESDMGNLLLENAADKATIATLEDTVGNLLLEVAALKGGAE
ncbi:hypothetical protein ACE3MQ_19745 [Paenibacillus lentus]|uniref:hypothetical protein n=1 Tax=Paenibacillus lentus TaxID=1338368 RepID=UPI00364690D7